MLKPQVFQLNDDMIGVRIAPDVIEVYQFDPSLPLGEYNRLCHVEWRDGQLWVPQGGLPREELKAILEEYRIGPPKAIRTMNGKPFIQQPTE